MKKVVLILAALVFAVVSLSAQEIADKKEVKKNSKISEVTLTCKMECGNCAADVKKQLAYTKGVKYVETDFEKDIVIVKYRNDRTDVDKLIASLGEIKYVASVYKAGCGSAKKGCCAGKTSDEKEHTGCAGKTTGETHQGGCAGKTTSETKTGCCSGKTTEPTKK